MQAREGMTIRRALLSVSDKTGIEALAKTLHDRGVELVATGRTAERLAAAAIPYVTVESLSGSPEAFQGRMKTLAFPICSGILYRRGDARDEADLKQLGFKPIDCVVVNFYPFEAAAARAGIRERELIEEVDIGGPTLVRAAAKNAPDVLVLTSPDQYAEASAHLARSGQIPAAFANACAQAAWRRVLAYDAAIAARLGGESAEMPLRYGENPHQKGSLRVEAHSPVRWPVEASARLTATELSYNNILDFSSAYALASDLRLLSPGAQGVVIVKHNNPCGVALGSGSVTTQLEALERAWEGDPVSAFGGVLVFTHPLEPATAEWLAPRFIELVAAPGLTADSPALKAMLAKRKNLKALSIERFHEVGALHQVSVPGGTLVQAPDEGVDTEFQNMTEREWPLAMKPLAQFGSLVCRTLKSNAIALVGARAGVYQLIGAGQGQPNRIEALEKLAIPRAREMLERAAGDLSMADLLMVSDAFFPFRDTVDAAARAGLRFIVQPGGSIKDGESITACNEHGVSMAFTGKRHFKH